MDAEGYLKSHGWRGLGYSLDQKDRGLKKPLLVSQKVDVLGIGKQKHQAQSDQWWMRAFDESLKQIGTGQQTTLGSIRKNGISKGGLYGFFVKGEALQGTLSDATTPETTTLGGPGTVGNPAPNEATQIDTSKSRKRKKEAEPALEVQKKRKLDRADKTSDYTTEKSDKEARRKEKREGRKQRASKKERVTLAPGEQNEHYEGEKSAAGRLRDGSVKPISQTSSEIVSDPVEKEIKSEGRKKSRAQKDSGVDQGDHLVTKAGKRKKKLKACLKSERGTSNHSNVGPAWHELTSKKREQYAARAAAKGKPPEVYYSRHLEKKAKAAALSARASQTVVKVQSPQPRR